MSLDRLHRKLRFPPKMNGNSEMVTLPCAFVAQLIYLSLNGHWSTAKDISDELDSLNKQAEVLLKQPIEISTKPKGEKS